MQNVQSSLIQFQNILHYNLDKFLNRYTLTKTSKVLYPFKRVYYNPLGDIYPVLNIFKKNKNFENILKILKGYVHRRYLNEQEYAFILSELYTYFYTFLNLKKIKENSEILNIKKITPKSYDSWKKNITKEDYSYFKPLFELKEYINKNIGDYLIGFYLHGSLSTLDYVKGWSDVDTLIILKKETIKDYRRLIKISRHIYKVRKFSSLIDPLQHHGPHILTEDEMLFYPQSFLPFDVIAHSTTLFPNFQKTLVFYERPSDVERIKSFISMEQFFVSSLKKPVNYFRRLYNFKYLLHILMMLPSKYLQAKNILCYKKYSFKLAKNEISSENWEIIDEISEIREKWYYRSFLPTKILEILSKTPNPLLINFIHYYTKIPKDINVRELIIRGFNLYKEMKYNLKKEGYIR